MRTTLVVKPYVWRNIPGHIVLFVDDFAPGDPANQVQINGKAGEEGSSIDTLKQRFGGTQKHIPDPWTHEQYLFDLSPWLHLAGETLLRLRWGFKPEHPIPPTDPRYPF